MSRRPRRGIIARHHTPDGLVTVYDTTRTEPEPRRLTPRQRRNISFAISMAVTVVTLACIAATLIPLIRSAL